MLLEDVTDAAVDQLVSGFLVLAQNDQVVVLLLLAGLTFGGGWLGHG